jgi:hypothetical protein
MLELVLAACATSSTRALPSAVCSGSTVRYFAFGSNLLLAKLQGRGPNGTTIGVIDREPATVASHRLAFNMRMFPPLEPAMASIEPADGQVCEGALYSLSRDNYEELWKSEGGTMERPGYEEIVVEASVGGKKVQAITLRAAPWMRLRRDAPPSLRYKTLILDGAREVGLSSAYIESRLEPQPAAAPSHAITALSRAHGVVAILLFRAKLRRLLGPLRAALYACMYAGSNRVFALLSEVTIGALLLPTACVGALIQLVLRLLGRPSIAFGPPPAAKPTNGVAPVLGGGRAVGG